MHADMWSLGVVLLQVVCGLRAVERLLPQPYQKGQQCNDAPMSVKACDGSGHAASLNLPKHRGSPTAVIADSLSCFVALSAVCLGVARVTISGLRFGSRQLG